MIDTIIFDLGNVLIRWDPTVIYRDYFKTEKELDSFFQNVCTLEWNEEQDKGRLIVEATDLLVQEHPHLEVPIRMYYDRWTEMILGPVDGTPEILQKLYDDKKYRLLALTNWSAELFPYALDNFKFLQYFENILVSGEEKMKKPDLEIYNRFIEKYEVNPSSCVFIDDSAKNIIGAQEAGINTIHFKNANLLKQELMSIGISL